MHPGARLTPLAALGGPSVDADVDAWAAAVVLAGGAAPSEARKLQMSGFVTTLKASANGWAQLSALQIFSAADATAGKVDLRYPGRVATWGATVVFAADDYAQGNNAADGGIDTGFDPTTDPLGLFTRNSNAAGIWIIQANTNLPVTYVPDFAEDDGSNYAYINSTDGAGNYRTPANSTADMATTNGGTVIGSFARNRTASNLTTPYQNGVAGATNASASAALLAHDHWIFAYRNGGAPRSNSRAAMYWAGSGSLDQAVMHAAASAYLTAIGAI